MLFELNKVKITEFVAVVFVAVPDMLLFWVFNLNFIEHRLGVLFGFIVVMELRFEGVVIKGVLTRHIFGVGRAMRRVRFYEFADFLFELRLLLIEGHHFAGSLRLAMLDGVSLTIAIVVWLASRGSGWLCVNWGWGCMIGRHIVVVYLVQSVLLENSQLQHLLLEVVLFVLVVVADLGEDIGIFLLTFAEVSGPMPTMTSVNSCLQFAVLNTQHLALLLHFNQFLFGIHS